MATGLECVIYEHTNKNSGPKWNKFMNLYVQIWDSILDEGLKL